MIVRLLFIIFTFLMGIVSCYPQSSEDAFMGKVKLDSLFRTLDTENKLMGSIFITKHDKKIYSNTIGYSSIKDNSKASPRTKYRIGSITKIYTAVLIFQLIDSEKLNIETPLASFFPNIKNAQKITIGNLLNHTSGIFNFTRKKDFNPYLAQTSKQMLEAIEKFEPDFAPGTQTAYSNTNFILLGFILEKIYEKPYSQILENQIVRKLHLRNTYYGRTITTENEEALSYTFNMKWEESNQTDMSLPHGAGAIVSTPEELTTFMNALMDGKLVSEGSFKKMTTIENGMGYGIGQFVVYDKSLFGHNGGIDGFRSLLIYEPKEKIAIALASNGSRVEIKNVVIEALKANLSTPLKIKPSIKVSIADLEKYVGNYSSKEAPFKLTFLLENGQLLGGPTGTNYEVLKAVKEHRFILESEGVTLDFYPNKNSLILSRGGKKFSFTKI